MISTPELRTTTFGDVAGEAGRRRGVAASSARPISRPCARWTPTRSPTAAAGRGFAPFCTIDGRVLPRQIVDVFDRGEQAKVPILAGFNSGEIRSLRVLLPPAPADAAAYEKEIRERYARSGGRHSSRSIRRATSQESMLATTRDALYGWTAERLVAQADGGGRAVVPLLLRSRLSRRRGAGLHAFHASELPYVFGTADKTPPRWPAVPATPVENAALRRDARATGPRSRATARPARRGQPPWPAVRRRARLHGVRRRAAAEDAPAAGHVRAQRAGRLPTPRERRHPVALERRARLAAAAARGRACR